VWDDEKADFLVEKCKEQIKFNIRPHCLAFLERMSNYFEIYVFTASTQEYAEAIVGYLNDKKVTIRGILSRNHCL
jgi:CTD small phosphatase-like protein 2